MNRRRLLALLPVAPLAVMLPAVEAQAAPAVVDTRPTFRLSDYRIVVPDKTYVCQTHDTDHRAYTHGCSPVAFTVEMAAQFGSGTRLATVDSVPTDAYQACPFSSDTASSHQHHDFRWIN